MRRVAALLAVLALFAGDAAAQRTDGADFALRLDAPDDGHVETGPTALVEVRGWAGAYSVEHAQLLDVAVIIDTSWSSRQGSGADVDGDGHAGGFGFRLRRSLWGWLTGFGGNSDPEDTILRAEVAAVRGLDRSLGDSQSRIGIVMMRGTAGIGLRVGEPKKKMDKVLMRLERAKPAGKTNMFEAIRVANQILVEAPDDGLERTRALILLSDGHPTVPPGDAYATEQAIEAAKETANLGIKIHAFALGLSGEGSSSYALREAARVTGGRFIALDEPGDVIRALSEIRLTGLESVTIENETTGKPASIQRVFPNGTFDAFVKLRQGANRLRIVATDVNGKVLTDERVVTWRLAWPHDRNARWKAQKQVEELQGKLRDRLAEKELMDEMEETRERLARELEISPE